MNRSRASLLATGLVWAFAASSGSAAPSIPKGFVWEEFSGGLCGPKYNSSAVDPTGLYGGAMFQSEQFAAQVTRIETDGSTTVFTDPDADLNWPAGLAFDVTGLYGDALYVGEAQDIGVHRIDPDGSVTALSLGLSGTAGIAFDPGLGYSDLLYCCQWDGAPGINRNTIMTVAPDGIALVWATLNLGSDPRYCAFDTTPGALYGGELWVTEAQTGKIRSISANGTVNPSIAEFSLAAMEGIAFGPDDPWWQSQMFVVDATAGRIHTVTPAGQTALWGTLGPTGSFILFVDGSSPYAWNGPPTMYAGTSGCTGENIIYRVRPDVELGVEPAPPAALARLGNAPNPFNPATRIFIEPTTPLRDARLEIFDAGGSFVRAFALGSISPPGIDVAWNGHDASGLGVPSGVYYYRVVTDAGSTPAARAVLTR